MQKKKYHLYWIYKKYHISMHFLKKMIFHSVLRIRSYFREKEILSFLIIQERSYSSATFLGRTIFSEHLEKISYFHVFFWEILSFIFRLKNKIIFSEKGNIIFPDNIRKIISQCNFFWEGHLCRDFGKRKYGFSCSASIIDSTSYTIADAWTTLWKFTSLNLWFWKFLHELLSSLLNFSPVYICNASLNFFEWSFFTVTKVKLNLRPQTLHTNTWNAIY